MAQPKPVVWRVVYSDGRAGTPAIETQFEYAGGVFDFAEKEFRGFATVRTTLVEDASPATQTISTFLTERVCAGELAARTVQRGSTVYARESATFTAATGGGAVPNQWGKCLPATRVVESVEGNEATKKARRTTWDFGDRSIRTQPAALAEWGEWDPTTNLDVAGEADRIHLCRSSGAGLDRLARDLRNRH
jgi:hypothetical protein